MGIDWRMGAEWFETCLLDYDPCSNYGNWTYGAVAEKPEVFLVEYWAWSFEVLSGLKPMISIDLVHMPMMGRFSVELEAIAKHIGEVHDEMQWMTSLGIQIY
ncbi:unnamed protein product [Ilex paraguariensis]|uniref:Cryptochrome/DNA photolyase FAD-binding domain-containing protein n=1 Tax=Ilex paraguariensis TaxID=185542 RepID=A0ABC8SG80_9AQUA